MKAPSNVDRDALRRGANVAGAVLLFAVVAIFLVAVFPGLVGADHSYVVRSDSMSPAIEAGGVVFVSEVPAERIGENDVITFEQPGGDQRVTHRVVEVIEGDGEPRFRTKGDANEDPDPEVVAPSQVIGKVAFSVPLIGYVIAFANTDLGLLTLVVLPALLLVVLEIRDILSGTEEGES